MYISTNDRFCKVARIFLAILILNASLLSGSAFGRSKALSVPFYKNWRIVANSDRIVKARLIIKRRVRSSSITEIRAQVIDTAKGAGALDEPVPYSSKYDGLSQSFLEKMGGTNVIIFLVGDGQRLYLARPGNAILRFNSETFKQIRKEVQNQEIISNDFPTQKKENDSYYDAKVRSLANNLTIASSHYESWNKIISLPKQAVPSLIKMMNDERPFAGESVGVSSHGVVYELMRYAPETVLGCLAIACQAITLESIDSIKVDKNHGARKKALAAWRVWAVYGGHIQITSTGDKP